MSYIEKVGDRWRLRDRVDGKLLTIVPNLGIWKAHAKKTQDSYDEIKAQGHKITPPVKAEIIHDMKRGLDEGKGYSGRRILVTELCYLHLKHYGPSLKGGTSDDPKSRYHALSLALKRLCRTPSEQSLEGEPVRTWGELYVDEVNLFHVRDLLAPMKTVGTRLRCLGCYGAMFNAVAEWNELGNILPYEVRLPKYNPFTQWRKKMKPEEKKEHPDKRVLTKEEWDCFKVHLTARSREICEVALRRLLRKSDIRNLSSKSEIQNDNKVYLHGSQQKTGLRFFIPSLANAPQKYDFTNFRRDFANAQKAAKMDWPPEDPRHFSVKDLRRTGATWLFRETKDIEGISRLLGHSKLSTTRAYLNVDEHDLNLLASTLDRIATDPKPEVKSLEHRWSEARN
jgi:hypothetical protein